MASHFHFNFLLLFAFPYFIIIFAYQRVKCKLETLILLCFRFCFRSSSVIPELRCAWSTLMAKRLRELPSYTNLNIYLKEISLDKVLDFLNIITYMCGFSKLKHSHNSKYWKIVIKRKLHKGSAELQKLFHKNILGLKVLEFIRKFLFFQFEYNFSVFYISDSWNASANIWKSWNPSAMCPINWLYKSNVPLWRRAPTGRRCIQPPKCRRRWWMWVAVQQL